MSYTQDRIKILNQDGPFQCSEHRNGPGLLNLTTERRVTVTTTIPDHWHIPLPADAITIRRAPDDGRPARIETLHADRMRESLIFLSGYAPGVLDAILTANEACLDDLFPAPDGDPEPYCAECGARAGVFAAHDNEWRHYTGDPATADVRPYQADHYLVVRWRPAEGEIRVAF